MKKAKMDAASKFRSIQADSRVLKLYRPKVVKSIQESIHERFEGRWAGGQSDPVSFIESLDDWIFLDLNWVETDVVPCFPPDYEIYSLYIKRYHKELDGLFNRIKAENPPPTVLLAMHGWVKSYKKKMKELDVPEELLEPPLMGGKEQSLIEDYARLIVTKLDEWTANLMKDELSDFSSRNQAPNQDTDGLYEMQGAIIFWQIINEQVDAATESGQGAILARIVTESVRVIRQTQEQWSKLIDSEFKKNVDGKPEDIAPGLAEYLAALANDQIKCADYAEALSARLEPMVSEKYKVVISEQLNDAIDGYLDVAKKCTQTIIDLMFHDLRPATKQLFQVTWYDGIMPQIVETLRDYMGDYQSTLNPTLLDLLIEDLLDTFLITYLTALSKSSKLRMQGSRDKISAPERIKLDVADSFKFFSSLKPAQELEAYFEIIELILDLLTASKSLAFLSFTQFADRHGPNLPFVEAVLRARDDLDRSSVNEVMESIKRKVRENNLGDREFLFFIFWCAPLEAFSPFSCHLSGQLLHITDPFTLAPQPTIMKKINVSSGLSRFLPL
jgi:exocyst complex component 3